MNRSSSSKRAGAMAVGVLAGLQVGVLLAVLGNVISTSTTSVVLTIVFGTLLGSWQRWDAGWFADIAQHGYASPESAAFFPLYPGLIHLGISITGSRYVIAVALVISNLAALVGFVGVALLTAREDEPAAAPAAVRALAAYPLAFFLAAPYSDALARRVFPGRPNLAAFRTVGVGGAGRVRRRLHPFRRRRSLPAAALGVRAPARVVAERTLADLHAASAL